MTQLASVGDFCPNPECEAYGDVEAKVIIHYGKTRDGRQRYQCKSCKKTFNERKGTLFYNRKTEEKDILECLALLAEGVRIRVSVEAKDSRKTRFCRSCAKRRIMLKQWKRFC